jgi:hypothetical protein
VKKMEATNVYSGRAEARTETDQKPTEAEIKSDLVRGETTNIEANSEGKDAAGSP